MLVLLYGCPLPQIHDIMAIVFKKGGTITLCLHLNPCVVLRHACQHIEALADVDGPPIQEDRINTSVFKLRGQSLAL